MQSEIWKDVPGYSGLYQVSNLGRVKSLARTKPGKHGSFVPVRERILKHNLDKDGYCIVLLCKTAKEHRHFRVHRLVAMAFLNNPENLPEIDHLDGNPANNNVLNLRYSNRKMNGNNPITRKRISISKTGERNPFYGKRKNNN